MAEYSRYSNFVESIIKDNNLINFKNNKDYIYMLEHVTASQGSEYLKYIRKTTITQNEIESFCNLNDSIGNPNIIKYNNFSSSPTSLRYIYHSHLILKYLESLKLDSIDIVEIGGGYGGLCLAIHFFSEKYGLKINSYTIIDLPSISKLQEKYIYKINPLININYIDATRFGSNISKTNLFCISNYCFSEISSDFQKIYINSLFNKVIHGFMVWNAIPVYNFGFTYKEENEIPFTGGKYNKYIYF